MSGVSFRRIDRDAVLERLRAYAREELARRPEVREAIVIGSLARGDWSARSDADVVVIVDSSEQWGPWRGPEYAPARPVGVPVDVLVYTADEAARWRPRLRGEVERGISLHRRPA